MPADWTFGTHDPLLVFFWEESKLCKIFDPRSQLVETKLDAWVRQIFISLGHTIEAKDARIGRNLIVLTILPSDFFILS